MTIIGKHGSHEAGVATQAGPGGQSATFGWCTCGWHESARDRIDARIRARAHLTAVRDRETP